MRRTAKKYSVEHAQADFTQPKDCATDDDAPCMLILRFFKSSSWYERAVARAVRDPIHVDIVMHKEGTPSKMFSYSAYMNEPFTMNLMSRQAMSNPKAENLALDITAKEFESCVRYLSKMVDRVEYNRSDAMLLMPMLPSSGAFARAMIPDVDPARPELLKSVYCSQAVVLLMRECLRDRRHVQDQLEGLNSRLTSPHELHRRVRGLCNPLVNDFFVS